MKKNKWIRSCLLSLILAAISISESKADNFVSIAYHDIKDTLEGDQYAVRTSDLIEQFEYFKMHGYTPVSLDDILQAGSGKKKLPQKAVLITVDDGLESFYTHFFPLIKAYQFPVVVSLVVSWLEKGGTDLNNISGAQGYKNLKVMTWEQVQEISQSGLVEIASHSYDLHRGILFNPQGNEFAAGSSFEYNRDSGTYEDRKSFRKRIFSDLKKSRDIIKEKTGKAPRVIVWPYGQFNQIGIEEAASLGMNINFSVMDGFNDTRNIDVIKRGIVLGTNDIPTFVRDLRAGYVPSSPLRFMQVTLDQIYSPDKKLQEKNLGELLERINYVGVNTVFVQGYSDPDGDGKTSSLYFPNRILPMKADLLNRVLHQIKTRTEAENAFAMMPLLSFVLPDAKETGASLNSGFGDGKLPLSPQKARSLSPFDPKTTETVLSIFEDLARTVHFAGVYFHESSDIRDFGPDAVQAFKTTFNEEFPPETVNSKRLNKKWEKFTAERLMMLSKKISEAVLYYRPAAKFLRSMSADQLSGAESEARFSQNYSDFLEAYDYVVLNASPSLNRNTGPAEWVKKISTLTGKHRHGTKKTLFTLQSFDLKTGTRVAPKDFFDYARLLYSTGIKHAGYTRGDLFKNQPPKDLIRRTFSLRSSPFYP